MSMNDSGPADVYIPPPAPAARKSPWLYVALGCGIFVALGFAGCVGGGMYIANRMKTEMNKPLDVEAVKKEMGDTPIYPGAKLDEMGTKAVRMPMAMMSRLIPAQSTAFAAYDTPDSDDKIFDWYKQTLEGDGWTRAKSGQDIQRMYKKGKEMILIQLPQAKTAHFAFMLMRFHDIKGGGKD